jgi:hypothetical protein
VLLFPFFQIVIQQESDFAFMIGHTSPPLVGGQLPLDKVGIESFNRIHTAKDTISFIGLISAKLL